MRSIHALPLRVPLIYLWAQLRSRQASPARTLSRLLPPQQYQSLPTTLPWIGAAGRPIVGSHPSPASQQLLSQNLRVGSVWQRPIHPHNTHRKTLCPVTKLFLLRKHGFQITKLPDYKITKSSKYWKSLHTSVCLKSARLSLKMVLKFSPKLLHERNCWHRRRRTAPADCL